MPEEEIQVVEQADQPAQAIDQATESEAEHNDQKAKQDVPTQQRKSVDYNWAEARRKMQELERRTQEQQQLIERLTAQKDEPELSTDDLMTVGHYTKMNAKAQQETLKEIQRQKEEIIRLRYPDIDQVLSAENIENFEKNEPELAETLVALQGDPLKMRVAAYKLIKKSAKSDVPPSMEKQRAEQNARKPVSVQAVGKGSALGNAHAFENGLTPDLKKQLYKEMQEAIKHG